MSASFVSSHLRRTTRNLLLTFAGVAVAAGIMLEGAAEDISAMVRGPRRVSEAELTRLARATEGTGTYVTFRAEDAVQVGEKWEERDGRERRTVADLLLAKVGEHAVLVEAPVKYEGLAFTGQLGTLAPQEREELSAMLRKDHPEVLRNLLPAKVDATRDARSDAGVYVALVAAALLLALWKIAQAVGRFRDPARHPSMRALAAYGGMFANAKSIDAEVAAGATRVGRSILTKSWLLHPSEYALGAAPLGEVLWFYKKVTKHYTNLIPTGKTFELLVYTRQAKQPVTIGAKQKYVDQLLTELGARAPWAMAGYSKEIEQAMAGPQRAEIAKAVEERRQQMKSAA